MYRQGEGDGNVDEMRDQLGGGLLGRIEGPYFPGSLGVLVLAFEDKDAEAHETKDELDNDTDDAHHFAGAL